MDNATFRGKLYKIDDYPGIVSSDDFNDVVQGEVYLLHQINIARCLLDQYEEFGQEFPDPNEFTRQKHAVLLKDGRMDLCLQLLHGRFDID